MGQATRMGMMGAVLGGLQFLMSEETSRRNEEADLVKLARLRQLDLDKERRDNMEWQRRQQIETEDAIRRDTIKSLQEERIKRGEFEFRASESAADREHDFRIEDRRNANDIEREQRAADTRRREHIFEKTFDHVLDSKSPKDRKGQYGKSGKWYPLGENIPPDDKIVSGAGVTFAPSESKSTAPGSTRTGRGGRIGEVGTSAAPAKPGSSEANPKQVWSIEEAEQQPPGTWIRLPNGKVGQR